MLKVKLFRLVRSHKLSEFEEQMNEWLALNRDMAHIEEIKITTSTNATIVLILYNVL